MVFRAFSTIHTAVFLLGALLSLNSTAGAQAADAQSPNPSFPIFAGHDGASVDWPALFAAMDKADVVIIGEQHSDAAGHAYQVRVIAEAARRWQGMTLSLEEFDRSQQNELNNFQEGMLTGAELKAVRDFVDPTVRKNWLQWYLPKLEAARDGGAAFLAANAPLKYSRLVRNQGCGDLSQLTAEERALFDCPLAPEDPVYKEKFLRTMKSISQRNQKLGMKPLKDAQAEELFRAQRVWDATMAQSIATARKQGAGKILHTVGSFHSDFNGGLIQELRQRDPEVRILVLCLGPKSSRQLLPGDRDRADFVIYTRG